MNKIQQKIYNRIKTHIRKKGYAPTLREIGALVHMSAPSVQDNLRILVKEGLITVAPGVARGIVVVNHTQISLLEEKILALQKRVSELKKEIICLKK